MFKLNPHGALPKPERDQEARQDFVHDFRKVIAGIGFGFGAYYETKVKPAYEKQTGHEPQDRHEVRKAMTADPTYQLWSASQRFSQELGWESVIDTVEKFGVPDPKPGPKLGSLELDPNLPLPKYHDAQDIHIMPGGYHGRGADNALASGAVFDLGVRIWSAGGMGPENDLLGMVAASYFQNTYPDLKPKKILDMGCTIGGSTVPWKRAFPDADIYAIDVAGPAVTYGHRRAEALGCAIHFSQQNAEKTNFDDESFDLVLSHIMLHETSRTALPKIFAETYRLLKPGGMALHFDIGPVPGIDHFKDFAGEWEVHNNNEAFLATLRELDVPKMMADAGFGSDGVEIIRAPGLTSVDVEEKGYFNFQGANGYKGVKAK